MDTTRRSSVMVEIRRVYEALQRFDLLASEHLGLNLTDLRCINILKDGPLSPGQIGQRLGLTSGSVTTMIDRLVARDVVLRTRAEHDLRSMEISLQPWFWEPTATVYSQLGHALETSMADAGFERSPLTAALLTAISDGVHQASDAFLKAPQLMPLPAKKRVK